MRTEKQVNGSARGPQATGWTPLTSSLSIMVFHHIPSVTNFHTNYLDLSTKEVLQAQKVMCMENITKQIQRRDTFLFCCRLQVDFLLNSAIGKVHLRMKQTEKLKVIISIDTSQDSWHHALS